MYASDFAAAAAGLFVVAGNNRLCENFKVLTSS
jgi:hypothetical protein